MRFTLVGTGISLPDAARGPAAFLVEREGARVLIDGGAGTMRSLARLGVDAVELDGGVYSHRHVDHCGELVPLLFAMRVARRPRDYEIWAARGFQRFLDGLGQAYPERWLRGEAWAPTVTELSLDGPGSALLPGGVRLHTRPANHSAGALHLSFTAPGGARVVFSGDTGPSAALIELAAGAEVLVVECALPGPRADATHMFPEAIRELVAAAKPERVLLTHLYPEVDEARALAIVAEAGQPVERAWDGQRLEL